MISYAVERRRDINEQKINVLINQLIVLQHCHVASKSVNAFRQIWLVSKGYVINVLCSFIMYMSLQVYAIH